MNQILSKIFCQEHIKELNYFCCDLECDQRIFCGQCLRNKTHISHLDKVFALNEIISDKAKEIWLGFQRNKRSNFIVEELTQMLDKKKKDLFSIIDNEFQELYNAIDEYYQNCEQEQNKISQIQLKVKSYISHEASYFDVQEAMQEFKQQFNQRMDKNFSFDQGRFMILISQIQTQLKDLRQQLFTTYQSISQASVSQFNKQIEEITERIDIYQNNQALLNKNSNERLKISTQNQQIYVKFAQIKPQWMKLRFQIQQNSFIFQFKNDINWGEFSNLNINDKINTDVYKKSSENELQIYKEPLNLAQKPLTLTYQRGNSYMILEIEDEQILLKINKCNSQSNYNNSVYNQRNNNSYQSQSVNNQGNYYIFNRPANNQNVNNQQQYLNHLVEIIMSSDIQLNISNSQEYEQEQLQNLLILSNTPKNFQLLGIQYA